MVSGGALAMDGGSSKSPLQNSFLEWVMKKESLIMVF